ncbi:TonB-dependent receptor [Sphingomonas paeninsulae]|uniref:TonB-dependent receptor n=1 Tax=Sphingomonas paeninsulae TaxID=2319844 RepID=A0A494TD19_SPHPE|nr:TonB-dependent receptor [Sphingomonas paeninsulae]AYJ87110.1 TonB-dependent receptor [Sphingomonas paeninsulae]
MRTGTKRHACTLIGLTALAIGNTATAQTSDPLPSASAADASMPADIVVTARRRSENAQNVPIALTALSGAQIAVPGTIGLAQVAQLAPSLQLTATNPRNTNINIRGLGATPAFASLGLEYGVGVYVDQVFYSRPAQSAFDLYDLARVEVLRGPQGTLFGKNTTAGAINIVSEEPSFTPAMRGELSLGNYHTIQARATATTPLTDTLAIRLTVTDTDRDHGFQTIPRTGQRVHDLQSFGVRGQLLFQPSTAFKLRLIGDYSDFHQDCCTGVTTTVRTTRIDGSPLPANFTQRVARFGYVPLPIDPYSRQLETNRPFSVALKTYGGTGIADLDLGPVTLTSVTGWRRLDYKPATDGDVIGLDIFENAGVSETQRQFSQELRLASNGTNAIDYVGGVYYFWQRIDDRLFTTYGPDAALWILGPAAGSTAPSIGGQAALNGLFADGSATARTRSTAAFGEATWHIVPGFDLTGGLRYTHEKKDGSFAQVQRGPTLTATQILFGAQAIRDAFAPNIAPFTANTTENNLSGRATIAYHVTSDIMAYATYARGFKSGGLNLNATAAPRVIAPEKVQNIEAGLKTQFFDRRLTLNLAAFTQRVRNYQSQQIDTQVAQTAYIANVGTVRSRGFELDARVQPMRGLSLFAAGSYTDATYRSFKNAPCPVEYLGLATVCDLSGRRLPGVSRYSASVGGEYAVDVGTSRQVYLNADHAYRSSFYTTYNLAADSLAHGYGVTNARLGLRMADSGWDVSLYARNLFDSHYISIINPSAFNTGQSTAILGDPRTYGITFKASL